MTKSYIKIIINLKKSNKGKTHIFITGFALLSYISHSRHFQRKIIIQYKSLSLISEKDYIC